MTLRRQLPIATVILTAAALVAGGVATAANDDDRRDDDDRSINVSLSGYEETLVAVSTPGTGTLRLRIDREDAEIDYRLSYANTEAEVTQAHIHFGAVAQSGGVSAFLCSNLTTPAPPAGTPACPVPSGTVSGTLDAADVIGPATQGIEIGEMDELIAAIGAGAAYVNVHTAKYPGGEIRSQLGDDHDHDDD